MPGGVTLRSLLWLVACVGLVGGRRGLNACESGAHGAPCISRWRVVVAAGLMRACVVFRSTGGGRVCIRRGRPPSVDPADWYGPWGVRELPLDGAAARELR
jgi:hypothetical protein